jgi:hypothetical protein
MRALVFLAPRVAVSVMFAQITEAVSCSFQTHPPRPPLRLYELVLAVETA